MINIVSKNITTLPSEICDIIYQYHKPQYLIDIENPFNKYRLLKSYWRLKMRNSYDMSRNLTIHSYIDNDKLKLYQTKRFNNDKYHLQFDNRRPSILPQYALRPECQGYDFRCKYVWYDLKNKDYRARLIGVCNTNDIEFRPREHTKSLIKKLMKL